MNVLPQGHPPFKVGKLGVLLINLGTPEGTSYWPMRRYLKEFLSDRRVIEVNPVLWWVLLNGIILSTRPKKSGHAYEQIWNREKRRRRSWSGWPIRARSGSCPKRSGRAWAAPSR